MVVNEGGACIREGAYIRGNTVVNERCKRTTAIAILIACRSNPALRAMLRAFVYCWALITINCNCEQCPAMLMTCESSLTGTFTLFRLTRLRAHQVKKREEVYGNTLFTHSRSMAAEDSSTNNPDGYTIDYNDMIGHGGFGYVYRGTNKVGVTIAAKFIDHHCHPKFAFEEASKCLKIRDVHPNIIDIFDVEECEGKIVICMEYCKFGNLRTYFSTHPLVTKDKVVLMAQIADGLAHLHMKDIIHRDVKPENILVQEDENGRPVAKLSDFGISKILEVGVPSTMSSDVGTSAFKAPEFWQRDKEGRLQYKRAVDVFAAGLTFLAMLQTDTDKKLAPGIEETHSLDVSEQEQPIGYTMYVRMKNRQTIPNIIANEGDEMALRVKSLIREMIHVVPEGRKVADDVKKELFNILAK